MKHLFFIILFCCINFLHSQNNSQLIKETSPLLKSKSWIDQCFAVLRLEKYPNEPLTDKVLLNILNSKNTSWQTKTFAIRYAAKKGLEIPEKVFQNLKNPYIAKAALLNGLTIDSRHLDSCIASSLKTRDIDVLMASLELCILANTKKSISSASTKARFLMRDMDLKNIMAFGDRLSRLFGIEFTTGIPWKSMSKQKPTFISPEALKEALKLDSVDLFTKKSPEEFNEFTNYYEGFQGIDLDIAVVIDGTGSMRLALQEVKFQTRNLMRVFSSITKSMQLSVVVYRDIHSKKKGKPEVIKLTYNFKDMMEFLSTQEATGGNNDNPESILSGIEKAQKLKWRKGSVKHLIILGDAPSHEEDVSELESMITLLRANKIKTHTVAFLTPFNKTDTVQGFEKMAKLGNGRYSLLKTDENNFAKTILKSSMDPLVHDLFDEFYQIYTAYCF